MPTERFPSPEDLGEREKSLRFVYSWEKKNSQTPSDDVFGALSIGSLRGHPAFDNASRGDISIARSSRRDR